MKPWFSLHLPNFTFPGATSATLFDNVVGQAKAAEASGFGMVTVGHFARILIDLGCGSSQTLVAGALLQLAVLDAKLLEFRGGRFGLLAPPLKVINDYLCLTVRAECIGGGRRGHSVRILQRHTTKRGVIAGVQIVRVVHD